MRKLFAMMILSLCFALPFSVAPAGAQTQAAPGYLQLIAAPVPANLRSMSLENWAAIGVGAIAGAVVVETFLSGGLFSLLGAVGGGLVGNWYYEQAYWPF